jgi:hypothetical protein
VVVKEVQSPQKLKEVEDYDHPDLPGNLDKEKQMMIRGA